ncbi:hypothetical protein like AT4G37700 [Hibiscus trionum]|uniref:Uncharacterized protein n=1 Tax=Hibiscus trionum TaxID=183268 RepID=A0A9W7HJ90_HIBTR|nr:hypothetical protein like AT4G37700 [Hibiscus trionum]
MSKTGSKESKLIRYLKAPIRFLMKAGDFYVKSMTQYSEQVGYGTLLGCPTGYVNTLPRSYSLGSTKSVSGDDDFRELLRAASTRNLDDKKAQLDRVRQQASRSRKMPTSRSVGIRRIDEDKPCYFEEDIIKVKPAYFPRSKSCSIKNISGRREIQCLS